MKYSLSTILAAFLFIACNSGKEKKAAENNSTVNFTKADSIISADTIQQITLVADTTPVSASRLIIPGKSIGLTSIDQKNTEVRKHLGPLPQKMPGWVKN